MTPDLSVLEKRLGYVFADRRKLVLALTHPSFAHEKHNRHTHAAHNQRLEFLGDAVLQLAVSTSLYEAHEEASEGEMTRWRTEIVREETLFRVAKAIDLGAFLLLGRGEALSRGADNPSNLADAVEAVLGAIYLDGGFGVASDVVRRLFASHLENVPASGLTRDYKSRVYEWAQSRPGVEVAFRVLEETGPEHDRTYTTGLFVNGELQTQGEGHSKKEGEQQASRRFLDRKPKAGSEEDA